jgi:hypothetical protein
MTALMTCCDMTFFSLRTPQHLKSSLRTDLMLLGAGGAQGVLAYMCSFFLNKERKGMTFRSL